MSATVKIVLLSVAPIIQDLLLVLLFFRGMVLRKKRKDNPYDRIVALSPVLLWAGAVCGGVLSIPVTLFGPDDTLSGVWCIFEVIVLACIAMMLAYCNETVTYDESEFEARNLFGIKHSYGYGEITGISRKGGDTVLRCGRRRIRLDTLSTGSDKFVAYADKAFFKQRKKHIPELKSKKDPMNGNLDTPWLYLVFSVFIFIASIGMIILPGFVLRAADDSIPGDAVEIHTTFSSFDRVKKGNGTILLHAPGFEKPFAISWLSGYEVSVPDPEVLCGGDYFHIVADEAGDQYYIYEISNDEHVRIISSYDHNTAYRNTQLVPCIFLMIMGVVSAAVSVFMVLVGRHPERYPNWFRSLFYKDSSWTSPMWKKHKHPPKRRR